MSFLYTILVRYTRNVEEDDFEFDEENIEKMAKKKVLLRVRHEMDNASNDSNIGVDGKIPQRTANDANIRVKVKSRCRNIKRQN